MNAEGLFSECFLFSASQTEFVVGSPCKLLQKPHVQTLSFEASASLMKPTCCKDTGYLRCLVSNDPRATLAHLPFFLKSAVVLALMGPGETCLYSSLFQGAACHKLAKRGLPGRCVATTSAHCVHYEVNQLLGLRRAGFSVTKSIKLLIFFSNFNVLS